VRALVLSAPYGSGHDRVAAALAEAFSAEGVMAEVADHFERFVSPAFSRGSRALFWLLLRWAPRLWGVAYERSARLPTDSPLMLGMHRLGARALGRELATGRHDLVIHVHPTPAGALSWLRARGQTRVPHAVVLTDFVAHAQWLYPHVDRYFVPDDGIRDTLIARGCAPERVVASGVPTHAAFTLPADREALRTALGVEPGIPAVLVTGGMHGWLGGITRVCEALAGMREPFRAIVVCGTHAGLVEQLTARFGHDARFRIMGYVAEMHRVMGAADLIVTKAGAVTCAEALALERPLVFHGSLPGQERWNEAFLEQAGAGLRARDQAALTRCLSGLLAEPARRAALAAGARRLRRPEAARMVVKEMLALVPPAVAAAPR
jgi:processive 1,2-diacylglycerol beta-glucosyltransferase